MKPTNYTAPSKARIMAALNISPETADTVRGLIRGEITTWDASRFPAPQPKTMKEINNTDDVIDSRNVIARIEELEAERDNIPGSLTDFEDDPDLEAAALQEWDDDNGAELAALKALAEEGEGCGDWSHGETLIRDSYFEDYARELADECGDMPRDLHWPFTCIDWEKAARELQYDYTTVDFDGVTYWIRSC